MNPVFDPATLFLAQSYTDQKISSLEQSGQAGSVETKIITYDGNGEKIDLEGDERTFAKISDNPVDFTGAKRAVLYERNRAITFPVDIRVGGEAGIIVVADGDGELIFAVSASQDNEFGIAPGVYMFDGSITTNSSEASEWVFYCASIELETIHPIDPKFIPGAVLPVVEIVKEGELSEPSALSEAEAETIEKIVNAGSKYILASVSVGGFPVATTILRKAIAEEDIAFVGLAGTGSVMIAKENGQWAIGIE